MVYRNDGSGKMVVKAVAAGTNWQGYSVLTLAPIGETRSKYYEGGNYSSKDWIKDEMTTQALRVLEKEKYGNKPTQSRPSH